MNWKITKTTLKNIYIAFTNAMVYVYFAYLTRLLINPFITESSERFTFYILAMFFSTWLGGISEGLFVFLLSLAAVNLLPSSLGDQNIGNITPTGTENLIYFIISVSVVIFTKYFTNKQMFLTERNTGFKKERDKYELLRKEAADILDSIGDAFLSVDENWRFTYINSEAKKLIDQKELISKNKDARQINCVLFNIETNRLYEEAIKDKTIVSFEHHDDVTDKWWHIRAYPKEYGLSIYATDITIRKKIEQERDNILSELNSLVAIAPVGIGFTDAEMKFFMVNRVFAHILDIPEYKYLYQTPYEVSPSKITEAMEIKMRNVTRTKEATSHEIRIKNGERAIFWKMIYYPVKLEENVTGIGIIAEDITEEKVEQRQKDQFISMVSHELKTPVTAIKAFIQILYKMPTEESAQRKEYYNKVNRHINRLTKLINDLLDISKIRSGKLVIVKEHFDFDKLIEDLTYAYRISLKSHQIVVQGKTDKIIFADRDRISQVYANLLNNAIKYSPGKKKIEVRLS